MTPLQRLYLDSFLQNVKSVTFFMFLPVLIAKLGASSFEIALSNSLPPLASALSLAFLTRQLPVTYGVYYTAGVLRQLVFLSMAFSALLPHPIYWLLFFWALNAIFVMITSVQQQALIRGAITDDVLSKLFGNTKIIGILVTIVGTYIIGTYLDRMESHFPYNYISTMVVGAFSTFVGMNLIARLAPRERKTFKFHFVLPFRRTSMAVAAIAVATFSFNLLAPLWTIYHVNELKLSNVQIGLFAIISGIIGTFLIPWIRKTMDAWGPKPTIVAMCALMALTSLFYGYIGNYYFLLLIQAVRGVAQSLYDISQQTLAIMESKQHDETVSFFSDYQLAQNLAAGLAPFVAAFGLRFLNIPLAFIVFSILGLIATLGVLVLFHNRPQTSPSATMAFHGK